MQEQRKLDDMIKRENAIKQAHEKLSMKKQSMIKKAKSNVLAPQVSPLKNAKGLSPEEKSEVRKFNKTIADPLQARLQKSRK